MNAMLTKYLKDFSAPAPAEPVRSKMLDSLAGPDFADMDFDLEPPPPPIDIEAERLEARQEGFREAEDHFESKHAEEIAALKAQHDLDLQALADAHESETIWMIHTRFHEMTQAISQSVTEQTLQVLLPLFDEELCRRAMANLGDLVREAIGDSAVSAVVVRGPESLYVRLKPLLETNDIQSRFIESQTLDIQVEVNDTVLVSRLGTWAQAISEVAG